MLLAGPLYKLATGDPTSEEVARTVAARLDALRIASGAAVILEAHTPHASGGRRPQRPYGASLWLRWPEFGIHLDKSGTLAHWRGQREERDWPTLLKRGHPWPWEPAVTPADVLWGRIHDYAATAPTRPTVRELQDALGASRSSVQRAIEAHRDTWEVLWQ